jgi:hypothetical protein
MNSHIPSLRTNSSLILGKLEYSDILKTLSGLDAKAAGSSLELVPTATLKISSKFTFSNFLFWGFSFRLSAFTVDCWSVRKISAFGVSSEGKIRETSSKTAAAFMRVLPLDRH